MLFINSILFSVIYYVPVFRQGPGIVYSHRSVCTGDWVQYLPGIPTIKGCSSHIIGPSASEDWASYGLCSTLLKKDLRISGPMQFRTVLLKGQLYFEDKP